MMHGEGVEAFAFSLEKTTLKCDWFGMWRALRQLWQVPASRLGFVRGRRGRFRDPRFVSFLVQSNRRSVDTHLQDAVLRGRRLAKQALVLAVAAGGVWFVVESAKALSAF
jgi:hypothetical protein